MSDFPEFPKIPRLSRECVITEKIDGTSGLVGIFTDVNGEGDDSQGVSILTTIDGLHIAAGSRSRWLDTTFKRDNYGFAKWVQGNAEELVKLGPGLHYGEWWGKGIQRNYGLQERRFSLFNTSRWNSSTKPACCEVVPVLYQGEFDTDFVDGHLETLKVLGSCAAPGFMFPEGVIVYHIAGNHYYKKTTEKDDEPKNRTS